MNYVKAHQVLPTEVIEIIQQYVEGQILYIPKKDGQRLEWGTKTTSKQETYLRNQNIYQEYLAGCDVQILSDRYHLSDKSIYRIIKQNKTNERLVS